MVWRSGTRAYVQVEKLCMSVVLVPLTSASWAVMTCSSIFAGGGELIGGPWLRFDQDTQAVRWRHAYLKPFSAGLSAQRCHVNEALHLTPSEKQNVRPGRRLRAQPGYGRSWRLVRSWPPIKFPPLFNRSPDRPSRITDDSQSVSSSLALRNSQRNPIEPIILP
jgi:hypothetical protein